MDEAVVAGRVMTGVCTIIVFEVAHEWVPPFMRKASARDPS